VRRPSALLVLLAALAPQACLMFQDSSGGFAAGGPAGAVGSGDDRPDGGIPDGAGGGDDGEPDPGAGGTAMGCSALPFGCACSPTEPTQVRACTTTSVVKAPLQRGVCCSSAFLCICAAYECIGMGAGCSCQLAEPGGGSRVTGCGGVTSNASIKCCRSFGQCVCSSVPCLLTETEVPACSVQELLTCAPNERSVETCEPARS
jgi:hypothetical protein